MHWKTFALRLLAAFVLVFLVSLSRAQDIQRAPNPEHAEARMLLASSSMDVK